MTVSTKVKIYHIIHVDNLPSVVAVKALLSDAEVRRRNVSQTVIGMQRIKERRLNELTLTSYPDLYVGECVPFYFCPRSIILYMINRQSCELRYVGGQDSVIHLECDLTSVVTSASRNNRRWAFTTTNAGSKYFEDFNNLNQLDKIDWDSVHARNWKDCKEKKQAEFLIERCLPWRSIERIGVRTDSAYCKVKNAIREAEHKPTVEKIPSWYY